MQKRYARGNRQAVQRRCRARSAPIFRISVGLGLARRVLVRGAQRRACIKTVTYLYGHYKFDLFGCYDSSFIDELGYGFLSLDYSVKMC